MQLFKKITSIALILGAVFLLTSCGEKKESSTKNESLETLMEKVYANVGDDEKPMMIENIKITDENIEYYLGTTDLEFESALASESGISSSAHSVVLLRTKKNANIEEMKTKIKNSVDPRKWICVEAEKVIVDSKDDLIILIMTYENIASKIDNSFKEL